jgi:hypothetical protein
MKEIVMVKEFPRFVIDASYGQFASYVAVESVEEAVSFLVAFRDAGYKNREIVDLKDDSMTGLLDLYHDSVDYDGDRMDEWRLHPKTVDEIREDLKILPFEKIPIENLPEWYAKRYKQY